jgi:hypothetical protein
VYNFPYLFDERNSQFMNVMKFQNKILMEDMGMDADCLVAQFKRPLRGAWHKNRNLLKTHAID